MIRDNLRRVEGWRRGWLAIAAIAVVGIGLPVTAAAQEPSETAAKPLPNDWRAGLSYRFIFPSVILATATRSPPGNRPPNVLGDLYSPIYVDLVSVAPNAKVVLNISIDELATPTQTAFTLPIPGKYSLRPRIDWQYEKLRTHIQPAPATMRIAATVDGASIGEKHGAVRIMSVNDVPTLIESPTGVSTHAWMFAAFVNEEHPWIDGLLHEAIAKHHIERFVGYQAGAQEVDRQVQAVYDTLHGRGIVYSSIVTNSSPDPRVHSQHVRFVSESVRYSQANCIDGVVLMASILRKIGVDPLIITGPGHAILGYRPDRRDAKLIHIVETTLVGTAPFAQALKQGRTTFDEWNSKHPHDRDFHVIDIAKERAAGVMPIAR